MSSDLMHFREKWFMINGECHAVPQENRGVSKVTVERLKGIMQVLNMTQADLSKETKIAPAQINRYLDKTTPSGANLVKISKALNTNSSYLLGETNYSGPLDEYAERALAEIRRGNPQGVAKIAADKLRKIRKNK